jgi:putative hydrolase of the HAD superfamily
MKIKAILLDMGGVLLEMGNAVAFPQARLDFRGRQAMVRWIKDRGGKVDLDDLERLLFEPWRREYEQRYERGREAVWDPHLTRLRKKVHNRSHTLALLRAWFRPYGEQLEPCEAAAETLSELEARGYGLALVSNVPLPGKLYMPVLAKHDLLKPLDSRHFSYDSGSRKPSPALLREALAALGAEPWEAVMVGDRRASDVAAGKAAGVTTIWLKSEDGGGPEPDYTIYSIAELPKLLKEL